jgi:hypothetical protein
MNVEMRVHRCDIYTQNIHNSSTRSHPSEEENRKQKLQQVFRKLSALNVDHGLPLGNG